MDRRAFLGAGVAAVGAGVVGLRVFPAAVDAQTRDAILGEALNQLQAAYRRLRFEPSGEALRMAAGANRVLWAWCKDNRADAPVRNAVRKAIREKGQAALVIPQFDMQAEMTARGFTLPPGTALVLPTTETMTTALSRIQTHGITGYFDGLSKVFADAAAGLDKRLGMIRRIDHTPEHAEWCTQIRMTRDIAEALVIFWCAPWMAGFYEVCAVAMAELALLILLQWYEGCG